jgi:transcription initiation factor TFIIIB Brf1 subunit/transcription initiation factor TFIIB
MTIVRCPKCGSHKAESVETFYEFDRMRCADCGYEEVCDEHQIKSDWNERADPKTKRGFRSISMLRV